MLIAVFKNELTVLFTIIFGTLLLPISTAHTDTQQVVYTTSTLRSVQPPTVALNVALLASAGGCRAAIDQRHTDTDEIALPNTMPAVTMKHRQTDRGISKA